MTSCQSAEPIAVLISVYGNDRLPWFVTAINSILQQDFHGEIRIYLGVDGPIPKDLALWIEKNQRFFFRIVKNQENIGLSKTLNLLLATLEHEPYIFRMDADDFCLPHRFARQISFLHTHPDIDAVGGAIWEFGENADISRLRSYPCDHDSIRNYIVKANPIAHVTVCFRKRFFSLVPAYPDKYRYNQDLALWVEGLRRGAKLANLDIPLVCVRTSDEFFRRRGVARGKIEFRYYLSGTFYLHGFSWHLIFPCLRFFLRLLPPNLSWMIYRSRVRDWFCQRET